MPPVPVSFLLDNTAVGRRVLESVTESSPLHRQSAEARSVTYYDTFDWRAYRHRTYLQTEAAGEARVLRWLRHDGSEIGRVPIQDNPGFVWDLPAGPLRSELESVLEMRRLLAQFTLDTRTETLHILDDRRKTVARLSLEQVDVHSMRGAAAASTLPPRLRAEPVRGYNKAFDRLLELLKAAGLEPLEEDDFTLGTRAAGLRPGDYTRQLNIELSRQQRSDEALKIILQRLFRVMRDNEEGLRQNIDSEFLHDFRVAVRRTRSALTQLKGVLPPAAVAHFKTEFSWLGQITGPTRDLDVYQLKMPVYRASLPESLRDDLDPLDEFLHRHQQIEHRDLVQLLETQRYRSLRDEWQRFLEEPVGDPDPERPEAGTPIADLASRRIWKSSRRVLKKGEAIDPDTPAEALHRLRIDCKKLRYLLEFFRSLYPEKQMRPLIEALKRLQDNLGDFNDLEVQQKTLRQFAQTMLVEKIGTVSSLMAMGRLVERLEHRQIEKRQTFHKRFARFASRKNRQRLESLFKSAETLEA